MCPLAGAFGCMSSSKNPIAGKVSVFALKNSLAEVKEVTAAAPCRLALAQSARQLSLRGNCTFSSMRIFFRDRGGRAMYWESASRALIENS
jgi:hypothetical protein